MWKSRQIAFSLTIASAVLTGLTGCQSGSRFAMFGQPDPVVQTEKPEVTQTAAADERLESSFLESSTASRLGGTSISHVQPHRPSSAKRTQGRPQVGGPHAGSATRNY